ncbi:MAG: bifunctional [glutamate--ammonia ligase]-adenylyl-L-tyrosine phosphorylase/[glutamate--ammonia-ligase] adenylyltransferase, partial [Methylococcales bacterium]
KKGYEFLRTVENRLQEYADQQVHDLPDHEIDRLRIAHALGFEDWNHAKDRIDRVRAQIHDLFEQVFVSVQADAGQGDAEIVWIGSENSKRLIGLLDRIGYREPGEVLATVNTFRNSLSVRKLSARGASELDRLMPLVLGAVARSPNPDDVLKKILELIESIASRKAYLALLVENPLALSQLVKLAAASSWIVGLIAKYPILLDELLDARALSAPLAKRALEKELDLRLAALESCDLERQMACLREFKQAKVLKIAAADIAGTIPVAIVSDHLTDLAEVVLERVLHLAWRLVAEKHGTPPHAQIDRISGFAVIAYGKLGGFELGYRSDLDLVFLFAGDDPEQSTNGDRPITWVEFYTKVGQRMINLLDTKMLAGVLYEIDMRLRPSGNSGCLVSAIKAFEQYQRNRAWTWEHQALVRARFVAGDGLLGQRFTQLRKNVLAQPRDLPTLKQDVCEMRKKMRENPARNPGMFDLKQGAGGLADIEFIVQCGVLLHAHRNHHLLQYPDAVRLLDILTETGFLSHEDAKFLKTAYFEYRNLGHRAALQDLPARVPDDRLMELRTRVEQIWQRSMA